MVTVALVRDQYEGRQMARLMSFAMAVFILVPTVAPALGAGDPVAGRLVRDIRHLLRHRRRRFHVGCASAAGKPCPPPAGDPFPRGRSAAASWKS